MEMLKCHAEGALVNKATRKGPEEKSPALTLEETSINMRLDWKQFALPEVGLRAGPGGSAAEEGSCSRRFPPSDVPAAGPRTLRGCRARRAAPGNRGTGVEFSKSESKRLGRRQTGGGGGGVS